MSESVAGNLAAWSAGLEWRSLPASQQRLAQLRLLDTLGLLLGGLDTEAATIIRGRARQDGGGGTSSVVGNPGAVSPAWAALANGVIAHCLDYDDTFPESVVHPGSVIVPVALAVGESVGATGADILTAIAGGYEIAARLAGVGGRHFHARGFHASGVFAPITAAFVAGRLLRLPSAACAEAAGLAASMSGGLLAFLADGSWSKWLHLGWGGFGGVLAAQLAGSGFRGPATALDGRHNLYLAFLAGVPVKTDTIDADLGRQWQNETALFKLYPCAHIIQPYIDLALELRASVGPAPVKRVVCTVPPWAVPIVCEPVAEKVRPRSTLDAIASLPYHVAAALIDGRVDIDTLAETSLSRPDIAALADRVGYAVDPNLDGFDGRLELETVDGRRFERAGGAAEMDASRLEQKFRSLAVRALSDDRVGFLAEAVATLAEAPNAGAVGAAIRSAAARQR